MNAEELAESLVRLDRIKEALEMEDGAHATVTRDPVSGTEEQRTALYAGLVKAQAAAGDVEKDGTNSHQGYKFASGNAIIRSTKAALAAGSLALLPVDLLVTPMDETFSPRTQGPPSKYGNVNSAAVAWLKSRWILIHAAGGTCTITVKWPVIPEAGKPFDKSLATARTGSRSYLLLDVLLLPRVDEDDEQDSERRDREAADHAAAQQKKPQGRPQQAPRQAPPQTAPKQQESVPVDPRGDDELEDPHPTQAAPNGSAAKQVALSTMISTSAKTNPTTAPTNGATSGATSSVTADGIAQVKPTATSATGVLLDLKAAYDLAGKGDQQGKARTVAAWTAARATLKDRARTMAEAYGRQLLGKTIEGDAELLDQMATVAGTKQAGGAP